MRKFYLLSALCLLTAFTVCGCRSTTPPEDLQPVPEARDDPSATGAYGSGNGGNGAYGNDFNRGAGFQSGRPGDWQENANDKSVAGAGGSDADGWSPADPTGKRLGMPTIYFAYDSDVLVAQEQKKLDAIADFMGNNAVLGVLIEGHCDQRGTDEYNRALGERRANAIRAYLAGRGVADNRIRTVSYGKDRPAVQGSGEQVWRQNRRGVPVPMRMGR